MNLLRIIVLGTVAALALLALPALAPEATSVQALAAPHVDWVYPLYYWDADGWQYYGSYFCPDEREEVAAAIRDQWGKDTLCADPYRTKIR